LRHINATSSFPFKKQIAPMNVITMSTAKRTTLWNIILLILRFWLGYLMMKNGRYFFRMFSSEEDRKFFEGWFGHDLHFPFPLFMAYLAKGAEFFGGLLVLFGLLTRLGASLIAITMLVATLTANLGKNWGVDGTITVSFCLFAVILVHWGGGKYAADALLNKKEML
jgi:putative oxidoreductase